MEYGGETSWPPFQAWHHTAWGRTSQLLCEASVTSLVSDCSLPTHCSTYRLQCHWEFVFSFLVRTCFPQLGGKALGDQSHDLYNTTLDCETFELLAV